MTVGEMCREDCVFTSFRMLLCIVMAGSWSDLQRSVWKCPVFLCRLPNESDFADVLKSAYQNLIYPSVPQNPSVVLRNFFCPHYQRRNRQ